jgi:hypothetical protein
MRSTIFAVLLAATGCTGGVSGGGDDNGDDDPTQPDAAVDPSQWDQALGAREVDYGQALRIAALRLTGELPTLAEIKFVAEGADPRAAYEAQVDAYLADPRFTRQIRNFFRDSYRMGGGDLDTAPNFAAQLVVEDRSFMELFTATAGNCPTYDGTTMTFTPADCASGAPVQAGVLTNPAVQRQFFSNMAFRRVRWVQETFVCTKFPAEYAAEAIDVGGAAQYTGPWAFTSIASPETGGVVDFRDVSAVICANCHVTMNHQAPLFAHFNEDGMWQADFAVPTPAEGMPLARLEDYLVAGETTAWRMGEPVQDLAGFGAAMAADPDVAECAVARVWNWAFGKGDIVAALALVPSSTIQTQLGEFSASGYQLKGVVRSVFTSDDFVKF